MMNPIEIMMSSTPEIVDYFGIPCRIWNGTTAEGVPCKVLVAIIAVEKTQDTAQFDAHLIEVKPLKGTP